MSDGASNAPDGDTPVPDGEVVPSRGRRSARGGRDGRARRGRGGRGGPASRAGDGASAAPTPPEQRATDGAANAAANGAARNATKNATDGGASGAAPRAAASQRARREVSAGGVVYRLAADDGTHAEPLFLLIRDSYRNWGFPKGHLERGEQPDAAALREVAEETGLGSVELRGAIETIDWYFRFRGRLIHKVCYFYLMETERSETSPQLAEGITACRWAPYEEAVRLVSYANAREVLKRAHAMLDRIVPLPPAAPGLVLE